MDASVEVVAAAPTPPPPNPSHQAALDPATAETVASCLGGGKLLLVVAPFEDLQLFMGAILEGARRAHLTTTKFVSTKQLSRRRSRS